MTGDADGNDFWAYFARISPLLARNLENRLIHDELDERVARLGPFSWEIGPGRHAPSSFAFTLDGDLAALPRAAAIVAAAPPIAGWELHPCRPPKEWDRVLRYGEDRIEIDARGWRYVLYQYEDQVCDVVLEAPNLGDLPREAWDNVADVVVISELGEQVRLEAIAEVEVVAGTGERASRAGQSDRRPARACRGAAGP